MRGAFWDTTVSEMRYPWHPLYPIYCMHLLLLAKSVDLPVVYVMASFHIGNCIVCGGYFDYRCVCQRVFNSYCSVCNIADNALGLIANGNRFDALRIMNTKLHESSKFCHQNHPGISGLLLLAS